jgi:hypothetical protein
MRMPGFSAEASMYDTHQTYTSVPFTTGDTRKGVLPQGFPVCGRCTWNTYDFGVPTCAKLCIDRVLDYEYTMPCPAGSCGPQPNCCPTGCVRC